MFIRQHFAEGGLIEAKITRNNYGFDLCDGCYKLCARDLKLYNCCSKPIKRLPVWAGFRIFMYQGFIKLVAGRIKMPDD